MKAIPARPPKANLGKSMLIQDESHHLERVEEVVAPYMRSLKTLKDSQRYRSIMTPSILSTSVNKGTKCRGEL
jgi:hypothetical protein